MAHYAYEVAADCRGGGAVCGAVGRLLRAALDHSGIQERSL